MPGRALPDCFFRSNWDSDTMTTLMPITPNPTLAQEPAERQAEILAEANAKLEQAHPAEILRWAAESYPEGLAMACSFGMQSVVMLDMLHREGLIKKAEVFYLDTGVLFQQTHATRLRLQEKYGFRAVRVAANESWDDQLRRRKSSLRTG